MKQPRPLVPARDTCSRPTPYRILERAPGMAFNFSSVLPQRGVAPSLDGDTVLQIVRRPMWFKPGPRLNPANDPFLPLHPALAS